MSKQTMLNVAFKENTWKCRSEGKTRCEHRYISLRIDDVGSHTGGDKSVGSRRGTLPSLTTFLRNQFTVKGDFLRAYVCVCVCVCGSYQKCMKNIFLVPLYAKHEM